MIGIDYKIDLLRALFASSLTSIEGNTYTSYGRAFINEKHDEGLIPEIQIPSSNEYKAVKFDDTLYGLSFMIVGDEVEGETYVDMKAKVDIYFAVNLAKLYPLVAERAVEYLHRDVIDILSDTEFEFISYVQGHKAFEEFTGVKISNNYQPNYLVKFSTEVEFQINENTNC